MTRSSRTPTRLGEWVYVLSAAIAIALVARAFVIQSFEVTSSSMEDTLLVGDRVMVEKVSHRFEGLRRGDVVVFDGAGSFVPASPAEGNPLIRILRTFGATFGFGQSAGEVFVKRVVGVPGDRVVCCDADGALLVNGAALPEPYLHPGDAASDVRFDVTVPAGRLWLLGDHRAVSADSRSLLGAPGGGMVPVERIIGRARFLLWPMDRAGRLGTTQEQATTTGAGSR